MSDFPTIIHPTTSFVDDVTVIEASHVNSAHDELNAISTILNKMQEIIGGYTYDRDYIEGLDVRFKTTSSVDVGAGFITISGTVYRASATTTINTTDNLRDGESITDNCLYNIYAFWDTDTLKFEFSTEDHDANFNIAGDTTRKWCGCIRRASGSLLAYSAYGNIILVPTPLILSGTTNANPSTVNLSEYIPICAVEIGISAYFTGQYSAEANVYFSPDSSLYWPLIQWQDKSLSSDKAENFFFYLPMITRSFQYRLVTGNYMGGYLASIKINRKRY